MQNIYASFIKLSIFLYYIWILWSNQTIGKINWRTFILLPTFSISIMLFVRLFWIETCVVLNRGNGVVQVCKKIVNKNTAICNNNTAKIMIKELVAFQK